MSSTKYQIFVSSTFEDLRDERQITIMRILQMGHFPVGMEMFSAADESQWATIKKRIDESDYYIVIVAHRYGSRDGSISYTRKEYEYAVSKGIPVLAFIIDKNAKWPNSTVDKDASDIADLDDFKNELKNRIVRFWTNKDALATEVTLSLTQAFDTIDRPGWSKATAESSLAGSMVEMTRLSKENDELRSEVAALKKSASEKDTALQEDAIRKLRKHSIKLSIWYQNESAWSPTSEVTLLDLFVYIAPHIQVECDTVQMAGIIAVHVQDEDKTLRSNWPVPMNSVGEILADLRALDIVCPSKKKHQVSDVKEYWILTDFGIKLSKFMRLKFINSNLNAADRDASIDDSDEQAPSTATSKKKPTRKNPKKAVSKPASGSI